MEKEQKKYLYDVLCGNCSKIIWLVIPRGLQVEQYLNINPMCPECGCKIAENIGKEKK